MDFKTYYETERKKLFHKETLNESELAELINFMEVSKDLMEKSIADENFDEWDYPELKSKKADDYAAEICDFTISFHMDDREIVEFDDEIINYLKGRS